MSEGQLFQFPQPLIQSIRSVCEIDVDELRNTHQENAQISVRINPFKSADEFDQLSRVPWASKAYYLPERISFIKDPLFHAGCYYVQEASSMFLEQAITQTVDLTKDLRVLDLCASPGGKSTLINSLLTENSLMVANEVIKTRVGALAENMTKWGTANVLVSNNDPKDFSGIEDYFDLIVVDAPCSGSGLFRKQDDAIDHWSEENVMLCSQRQQRILADVMPALAEGGILIYSTCSYSAEENETISAMLVNEFGLENIRLTINEDWKIVETDQNNVFGYRFFPHLLGGEGFFISVFRRPGMVHDSNFKTKGKWDKPSSNEQVIINSFVNSSENLTIVKQNEKFFLINKKMEEEYFYLAKYLQFRKRGTWLGEIKGKDFIPNHELALSIRKSNSIPEAELSEDQILKFLRKEEVKTETLLPKGFCLVTCKGHSLGWIKNIGNRINNYLPKEWRVLKEL